MFRLDNFLFGLMIGFFFPIIFILGLNIFFLDYLEADIKEDTIYVLSVLFNFLIFRFYMINMEMDKTGRGILLATFGYAFVYIYLYVM